jgi:hypothetical protein
MVQDKSNEFSFCAPHRRFIVIRYPVMIYPIKQRGSMRVTQALAALFIALSQALATVDDVRLQTLTLKNGNTYDAAVLKKISATQATLVHSSGVANVELDQLPDDIASKLGYSHENKEAAERAKKEIEQKQKAATADAIDFKGLRLRMPLTEMQSLVDKTLWSFDSIDILQKRVNLNSPYAHLSLQADDPNAPKNKAVTGDQYNTFRSVGKEGFGAGTCWYSWWDVYVQFVDGKLAMIHVSGLDRSADELKTDTLRWLEFAEAGLRKKYGDPAEVRIPLDKFTILDTLSNSVVFVSRWAVRGQTIYLGVSQSDSKFKPVIILYDDDLQNKFAELGKGESKL